MEEEVEVVGEEMVVEVVVEVEVEVVEEEMVLEVEVEVEVEEVVQGRQTWFRSAELCCLLCIC